MYWRLILDPPHTYAAEQGFTFSRRAKDFVDSAESYNETWRCPITGLVMLNPSFRRRNFANDFRGLGNFTHNVSVADYWRAISKSMDSAAMFTNTRPAGQVRFFDPMVTGRAKVVIDAADDFYDNLEWALESNFTISIDEGFVLHYRGLTDELLRKNNWMAVQWDNIYIHFSHQGHVRVYQYADRGDLTTTPVMTHEFDIADPGDLLGKNGQFVFLPIPGYGLAMYHLLGSNRQSALQANTGGYSLKGAHMIPWDYRKVGTHYRLFETSAVRLALNPFHAHNIGFSNLTFSPEGTYLEAIFDPGYQPSFEPDELAALGLLHFGGQFGEILLDLRKTDNSADWVAGTDRQGRVRLALLTSDDRYTPFIYEWGVRWLPVTITRAPGQVIVYDGTIEAEPEPYLKADVLQRLEMTDDSEGQFEGSCRMKLQTRAACIIAERGSATYQVEYSEDAEDWTVYNGGIIKFDPLSMMYHPDWGFFWQCTAKLHGQEERFEELPNYTGTSFDGLSIGTCINLVLSTTGFAEIAEADMPAALINLHVPALQEGTNARFHPRRGDKGKRILRMLLFMARTQHNEYKMRYDWVNEVWQVLRRPRGEEEDGLNLNWRLTYNSAEEDFSNQVAYYDEPYEEEIQPVEATGFRVIGMVEKDEGKPEIFPSAPIENLTAITDSEIGGNPNMDYTGRAMGVNFVCPGIGDVATANEVARKIHPRFFHRNVLPKVILPAGHSTLDIGPDIQVTLVKPPYAGEMTERELVTYVKKRTVVVESEDHGAVAGQANERAILELDTTWENSFKGE